MRLLSLPALDEDPRDEAAREFQDALSNARLTDAQYLETIERIDPSDEQSLELGRRAERNLRDRLRGALGMGPRQTSSDVSLAQHARNNEISPSYDLPLPKDEHKDGRHNDTDIQTLLLPEDLERKLNALTSKCRTWMQETGINVLHAAFGFLEWTESGASQTALAPLILLPIEIDKKKTKDGPEFWVNGLGDEPELNTVLAEKLRLDFGTALTEFEGGSVEEYLGSIAGLSPKLIGWKVRRQVAVGVFPSARMAMYHDLDTSAGEFDEHEIVRDIFGGNAQSGSATPFAEAYDVDRPEIERKVPCLVLDADSSQFSAIVDVMDGKNLAVEGPPGTGKSQTIVNTVAAALAEGKKVLFVAEKMAALNVVKSRLQAVGLGEFILPLQADRATREQVVQSIKERMDMRVGPLARDYDRKLTRLRETRAQIKEYIDLMSAEFGRTGVTVHGIIGKSIATGAVLGERSEVLQRPNIPDIERYDRHRIEALGEAARNVAAGWSEASAMETHWRGLEVPSIDRFVADEITGLARAASERCARAANSRAELSQFGIDASVEGSVLDAIARVCSSLEPVERGLDRLVIGRLCREGRCEELSSFLNACIAFQEEDAALSSAAENPTDDGWGDRLRQLHQLCHERGVQTLDTGILRDERAKGAAFYGWVLECRRRLEPFVAEVPESANWTLASMRRAGDIVAATPRDVLALRNGIRADPAAAIVVEKARARGMALRERREQLGVMVCFDIPVHELMSHAASLQRGRFVGFMLSDYRRAKQTYLTLSRGRKFNRDEAVGDLVNVIEWRESERKFAYDPQFATVFGVQYKGLDTEFDPFCQLMEFYGAIDRELPGGANRGIRQFLKTGDLELLESLPELGDGYDHATFNLLKDTLGQLDIDLASMDETITYIEELGLKGADRICVGALPALAGRFDAHASQHVVLEDHAGIRELLGERFAGAMTSTAEVEAYLAAASNIEGLGSEAEVALRLLETGQISAARGAMGAVLECDAAALGAVKQLSGASGISVEHFCAGRWHQEVADFLAAAAADTKGLYAHASLCGAREDLRALGGDWIVEATLTGGEGLKGLAAVTEAVIFRALAAAVYARHRPVLSRFPGSRLNQLREQFAELDREIMALSRSQLRAKILASARPPAGIGEGRKSTWTEMALLDNEVSKTRRFLPVRDVTRRAGHALLELKPCWMMSPLAVAQYIPKGTVGFDLVIIDEGSQMPPEDAVGALVRGKQAMVVGDRNQLPPTSFFKKMIDDEDADEDETVLEESILDMANGSFRPARRLRWHYRSRNSALISFSNHYVYDNDLIVFPSAEESTPGRTVRLHPVRGRYSSGTNVDEARVIIDATIQFMKVHRNRSLGVVVLNQKQRDLLQEEMEHAVKSEPAASEYIELWKEKNDGLEEFFIKNLENVQGDERDVIFIGTVYGPEKVGGPVMQRFGPINGLAGKRRLNVLFSRAKHELHTFSSMTSSDIKADENGNAGAYMLKCWLEYSATGVLHVGQCSSREPDSDLELFVMDRIRAMGYTPVPQVGAAGYFIDIAVKHPEWPHGYVMAVECDGASYHSSKSARDRDRLRQQVLEGLGWHFHRVWSTDWFNDSVTETGRLRDAIMKRLEFLRASVASTVGVEGEMSRQEEKKPCRDDEGVLPRPSVESPSTGVAYTGRASNDRGIQVGDRVRVRYVSGTANTVEVTLSEIATAPERGVISVEQPLGQALLGAQEGDEIEVLIGSYVRKALIERVVQKAT